MVNSSEATKFITKFKSFLEIMDKGIIAIINSSRDPLKTYLILFRYDPKSSPLHHKLVCQDYMSFFMKLLKLPQPHCSSSDAS